MIYLVLAIFCSAIISIIMKISNQKTQSSAGMFIFNYMVCLLLSRIYITGDSISTQEKGLHLAISLGIFSGFLYLANFVLLQQNIQKNGIVLASIFMKLGLIISILIAILFFHESPSWNQVIGIILALTAIFIINYEKHENTGHTGNKLILLILFFASGITDSMANIYDKIGNPIFSDNYLFCIFSSALIFSIVLFFIKKEKLSKWDILFGMLIGIPNYYSSRFLLLSLNQVSAVVIYPVFSVATIILISLAGLLFFHESLSKQKLTGLCLVVFALIFLNI